MESNESIVVRDRIVLSRSTHKFSSDLRTMAPRKTIFATRFHCGTTVDEVKNYVSAKTNCNLPKDIQICKIRAKIRTFFKIIVPLENFQEIVNSKFWFVNFFTTK